MQEKSVLTLKGVAVVCVFCEIIIGVILHGCDLVGEMLTAC